LDKGIPQIDARYLGRARGPGAQRALLGWPDRPAETHDVKPGLRSVAEHLLELGVRVGEMVRKILKEHHLGREQQENASERQNVLHPGASEVSDQHTLQVLSLNRRGHGYKSGSVADELWHEVEGVNRLQIACERQAVSQVENLADVDVQCVLR